MKSKSNTKVFVITAGAYDGLHKRGRHYIHHLVVMDMGEKKDYPLSVIPFRKRSRALKSLRETIALIAAGKTYSEVRAWFLDNSWYWKNSTCKRFSPSMFDLLAKYPAGNGKWKKSAGTIEPDEAESGCILNC